MSHAHAECAKAMIAALSSAPGGLTRLQLYRAVHSYGKTMRIFGACLSTACEAGDVIMQPQHRGADTTYKAKKFAHIEQGAQLSPMFEAKAELVAQAPAQPKVIVIEKMNRDQLAEARRKRLMEIVQSALAPITTREIHEKSPGSQISRIRSDLDRLRTINDVQSRTTWVPISGLWQTRWWPKSMPWPVEKAIEAPAVAAAAPARATDIPAAPAGAADPAQLAEWKEIDAALEGAYVYAKKALHLHRQRRPA